MIAEHIHLLDSDSPDGQIHAGVHGTGIGLRVLKEGDECAVTLASNRGPDFIPAAVKLSQAASITGSEVYCIMLKQLLQEGVKDSAVSLLLLLLFLNGYIAILRPNI